ncbi:uncharacterized protein L201_008076 [Kwoniella dendrophila CBS 6074]|uniref:Very-long-chain (3R)-3-hydroxyacyl-CoA dehydratase n=1 Tax=Kwoniella dendrophila CBS 6074 TaxID=1295534 RepID=A0AAX4K8H1_9TREE
MSTSTSNKSQMQGKERVEQEKERIARKGQEVKSGLTPVKIYLLAYNGISALLWGHLLYITLLFLFTPRTTTETLKNASASTSSIFDSITNIFNSKPNNVKQPIEQLINHLSGSYNFKNLGYKTKFIQSLAILEIFHTALGLVKSPLGTVASQVASRLWTVWGVVEAVPEVSHSSPLFTTMLLAWSLTEIIRYSFYFLNLLGIQSKPLNWLRYTTFIPLYPLGASSEAFLSLSTLPSILNLLTPYLSTILNNLPKSIRDNLLKTKLGRNLLWSLASKSTKQSIKSTISQTNNSTWGLLEFVRLGLFFIWWPALYVLYTYMFKQRRKVLGKGKGKIVGGSNKSR